MIPHESTCCCTGQLRAEGDDGSDGHSVKTEPSASPSSTRKMVFSHGKKSIFKRHSSRSTGITDSPKRSPRHAHNNISEVSDERSESSALEGEKERKAKGLKKFRSFKKVAMKVKVRRKMVSKGSSSEEREDTDMTSLGCSEGGEEEGEGGEGRGGDGRGKWQRMG